MDTNNILNYLNTKQPAEPKKLVQFLYILCKGIMGGTLISLACIVSSKYDHPELIFPVGLICVVYSKSYLYTGCVGHCKINMKLITVLLGNLVGCIICVLSTKYIYILDDVNIIGVNKYQESFLVCFLSSMFCGILMCVATSINKNKNIFCIVFCVAAFVICGLDHSIANTFYLLCYKIDVRTLGLISISVVGNGIGAKMVYTTYSMKSGDL